MNHLVVKTGLASGLTINTPMYSMCVGEWAEVKVQLLYQLNKLRN